MDEKIIEKVLDEKHYDLYLKMEPNGLVEYLRKDMSPSAYADISAHNTDLNKNKALLDWIRKSPRYRFTQFLKGLLETKQKEIAYGIDELIKDITAGSVSTDQALAPITETDSSSSNQPKPTELPKPTVQKKTSTPVNDFDKEDDLEDAAILDEMHEDIRGNGGNIKNTQLISQATDIDRGNSFDVTSDPRGLVLLINNVNFE